MNDIHKNDIGLKVVLGILALIVTSIMSYAIASSGKANEKANINAIDIRGTQVAQQRMGDDIREIKLDIRKIMEVVVK